MIKYPNVVSSLMLRKFNYFVLEYHIPVFKKVWICSIIFNRNNGQFIDIQFLGSNTGWYKRRRWNVGDKMAINVDEMDFEETTASKAIPYFKIFAQSVLQFNQKHVYFNQVQGHYYIEITNRSYCLFGVFTSGDFLLKVTKMKQ